MSASARTLAGLLFDSVRKHRNPKAFLSKVNASYEGLDAARFEQQVLDAALGLRAAGLEPGDRIGILARSSVNWALADLAVQVAGGLTVPIYPTLPAESVVEILEHAGCRALFAEDAAQAAKLAGGRSRLGALGLIVQFGGELAAGGESLAGLQARGAGCGAAALEALRAEAVERLPDSDCSVVYTSGTSGSAKGVLLSHRNIISNVEAARAMVPLSAEDVALSCLPLSHLLERTAGLYAMLHAGATIAYAESTETIARNLLEVRPTVMIGVPRLYEKMYARIRARAAAAGPIQRRLFAWAQGVAAAWTERRQTGAGLPLRLRLAHRLADRLVYGKLRARTGGRLRFFVSGGAPLAPEIATFFYAAGLPILEGYGLTETSPIISVNSPADLRVGSVGRALPGVELRIAPDGEILTRGPHVMRGYYRDAEATRAALSEDGWFATGDIGELDAAGYLRITDRKKDLIVTAGGKNVAPQPLESRLRQDPYISECVLLGDGRPFIAALIVPDFAALAPLAAEQGIRADSAGELLASAPVRELYAQRLARFNASLARHEQVRGWRLLDHELSLGAGELTPSLKVRRHLVLQRYAELVEAIYARRGATPTGSAAGGASSRSGWA